MKRSRKSKRTRADQRAGAVESQHHVSAVDERQPNVSAPASQETCEPGAAGVAQQSEPPIRVAILSFLFNWPSTGGGIVHTVELADFLGRAGYVVRHFYARHLRWGVGKVTEPTPFDSVALDFNERDWHAAAIQARFREAVASFDPDYVLITDSWNFKPLFAEAVREFPYYLRLQASECLCPLNNLRFLPTGEQCATHQLADPVRCRGCVARWAGNSGSLHQAERELVGFGTPQYEETLRRAFAEAEGVLVVNELAGTMIGPYAQAVHVVTSGFDPDRFAWPEEAPADDPATGRKTRLLMAGLVDDHIKGYHVLAAACEELWRTRRDFEVVVTGDPPGQVNEYTRFIGWQSQADLPDQMRQADIIVVPTVAQDALGRTAVEAMAARRPVVASRLGGLPYTIADGAGLLFTPGDAADLAAKLRLLLDDPGLRRTMGRLGRRRFDEEFTWQSIIDRHYRRLLAVRRPRPRAEASTAAGGAPLMDASLAAAATDGGQGTPQVPYSPFIPDAVDHGLLLNELAEATSLDLETLGEMFGTYRNFHYIKGYEYKLGERKTLCFEEAFVLHVLLSIYRPRTIVEIGTQHGKSTRRLLDSLALLGLESRVAAIDIVDLATHFRKDEAELFVEDVCGDFRRRVLERFAPEFLFVDVHRHALLDEIVRENFAAPGRRVLAIHDCAPGLCNPQMTISKDDPQVTSLTGTWERHVLAEHFGVADPLSRSLDAAATATHRLTIFSTPHGLGVILPRPEAADPDAAELAAASV